ncbi:MAG TPA: hypothetical protein VMV92_32130 [Streptosporangiaceae bacterium]|nr:hypothetical protein [Streptosporangiaceae bacterium]
MGEERLHADAQALVVAVDGCPCLGFASDARAADAGQDRCNDVVAEGEQRGDGAGCGRRRVRQAMEGTTGLCMVGLGASIVLDRSA